MDIPFEAPGYDEESLDPQKALTVRKLREALMNRNFQEASKLLKQELRLPLSR
jgi:hypothetical protein